MNTRDIYQLCDSWKKALAAEREAKAARIAFEDSLAGALDLPDAGTTFVAEEGSEQVKVKTHLARHWDQDILRSIREQIQSDSLFPFTTTFTEQRDRSKFIENNEPDTWNLIRPALTLRPRKAYFFIQELY